MAAFVTDSFTDTSGTALTSHTGELGATWAAVTGLASPMAISSANRCRNTGINPEANYASGTPPGANYTVSATVHRFTGVGEAGVLARCSTSAATYYRATITTAGSQTVELYKFVAGTFTRLGGYALTLADNTDYTLALTVSGTAITVSVDGTVRITVTDSAISAAGQAGVYAYQSTNTAGYNLDNFSADTALSLTSGVASVSSFDFTTSTVTCSVATGGTAPYTYQWQRKTGSGGTYANVSSATSLTLNDTGLSRGLTYYYQLISTDSVSASVTSNAVLVTTYDSQLVADGNSQTAGAGGTSWATQIVAYISTNYKISNVAVSGQTTRDMITRAPTFVVPLLLSANSNNIVVGQEVMNDIYFGQTGAQAYANLQSYSALVRGINGSKLIVICPQPDRGDFPGTSTLPGGTGALQRAAYQSRVVDFMALFRSGWRSFCDGWYDPGSDQHFLYITNTTYFAGDLVHWTTAGQTIVASGITGVMPSVIYQGGSAGVLFINDFSGGYTG